MPRIATKDAILTLLFASLVANTIDAGPHASAFLALLAATLSWYEAVRRGAAGMGARASVTGAAGTLASAFSLVLVAGSGIVGVLVPRFNGVALAGLITGIALAVALAGARTGAAAPSPVRWNDRAPLDRSSLLALAAGTAAATRLFLDGHPSVGWVAASGGATAFLAVLLWRPSAAARSG